MEQVVESIFAPPHSRPLKALLDHPFTGTFYHTTANRQAHSLEGVVLNIVKVKLQVISNLAQDYFSRFGGIFRLT